MFKFFTKKRKRGQSTLEYTVLMVIVIGALISLQVYIKRGLGGRYKSAADDIGDQYSIGNMNYIHRRTTSSRTKETFLAGVTNSQLLNDEITLDLTNAEIMNTAQEYWGGVQRTTP